MRVDGVPNVRTCVTRAEHGMVVETQGGLPTTRFDLLSILDLVYRKEFDYQHRFIRPRFMTPFYQMIVRRLASASRVPSRAVSYPPVSRRRCDALIVGSGVSGSVAHNRLQVGGVRSLNSLDMRLGQDASMPAHAFGFYESGEVASLSERRVELTQAKAVLIATGRHETGLPLPNGDLPGVILPAALHLLSSRGIRLGARAVVVGSGESRDMVVRELEACGSRIVGEIRDPRSVSRVLGTRRVRGVETSSGPIPCDLLVELGPLVPAVELAYQAGCELRAKEGSWIVKVDARGRTSVPGVYACGGVAGFTRSEDRISSAEAAAEEMLKYIRGD
jgi:sarcosine oxidase subunit alpha